MLLLLLVARSFLRPCCSSKPGAKLRGTWGSLGLCGLCSLHYVAALLLRSFHCQLSVAGHALAGGTGFYWQSAYPIICNATLGGFCRSYRQEP